MKIYRCINAEKKTSKRPKSQVSGSYSMVSRIKNRIRRDGLAKMTSRYAKAVYSYGFGRVSNFRTRFRLQSKLSNRIERTGKPLSNIESIETLRRNTLHYIEEMRIKGDVYGQYRHSASVSVPTLYASIYAVLTRHLYSDLHNLSKSQREEWISDIQSHQDDDGLFKDPLIENEFASVLNGWGWRHLTLHALMALTALGATPTKQLKFLQPFYDINFLKNWLASRDWGNADVSNEVQNYTTALQYSRCSFENAKASGAISFILDWLDSIQDPGTGLWGSSFDTPKLLLRGVQVGYHLWLLYFYEGRRVNHLERIIDSILRTQNKCGGFGVPLNCSACEDIDSIDPLVRLYQVTEYRREDMRAVLQKTLPWVLANMNEDGGFVFKREVGFTYFHELLSSLKNQSGMFPTWFRTLSLAYIGKVLTSTLVGKYDWQFIKSPGHQFWLV